MIVIGIISLVVGVGLFIAGSISMAITVKKQVEINKEVRERTEQRNQLDVEIFNKTTERNNLNDQCFTLKLEKNELQRDIVSGQQQFTEILNNTEAMRQSVDEEIDAYKNKAYETMQSEFAASAEKEAEKFREAKEEYEEIYTQLMEESAKQFNEQVENYNVSIEELEKALADWQSKVNAAVTSFAKTLMESEERNFYRIQLSEIDKNEIKELRSIIHLLRNPEPLNKVIYKVYYENPANDMITRVTKGHSCGIYKITNLLNNKCYVGQTVDFANRWKQHIKRGLGADTPTRNKLYPAMMEDGVENFSFEIIEDCPVDKLNEREDYWQTFWHAKEFGYSIR